LASASENGKIVVWDLKTNKPIFTFTEPSSQATTSGSGAGGADDYFDYFGAGSGQD
jgi:WD40 repeat protein